MQVTAFSELTIDGKLSLGVGHSSKGLFQFYGPELAHWFHAQRAAHDAIMVGAGTVRVDNPELTVRNAQGKNPLRVVSLGLTHLRPESTILTDGVPTLLAIPSDHTWTYQTGSVKSVVSGTGRVDLTDLMSTLWQLGIRTLMVEGGSRLLHAFFTENLIDRIVIKHIPVLAGDPSAPSYLSGGKMALSEWHVEDWRLIGGIGVATYAKKSVPTQKPYRMDM